MSYIFELPPNTQTPTEENLSAPGRRALHDLAILPLPGPGLTAHNAAYVAPRAAIGKTVGIKYTPTRLKTCTKSLVSRT